MSYDARVFTLVCNITAVNTMFEWSAPSSLPPTVTRSHSISLQPSQLGDDQHPEQSGTLHIEMITASQIIQ